MTDSRHTAASFRSPFRRWTSFDIRTGLILLGLFTVVRFGLVLEANVSRSYALVSVFFVVMAVTPLILLGRAGQRRIGMTWPARPAHLLSAVLLGALCCGVMIVGAEWLFGSGDDNAFRYIAGTYAGLPSPMDDTTRLILFLVFAAIGMTFSPIGEELFYRGLAHECFAGRLGEGRAAAIDAAAFALVHLAHFGLIWRVTGWTLLPGPALWWVGGLFITGLIFFWSRRASGSITGAIVAHAGFNLAMTGWIFYGVLPGA
ncbi:MAG TPA: CPBP family intramembrane glutamic endopeptidase [Brevundimonas sp.]|nr:CPBP family intramembrane glutamic endopeptidase [Brevundimonas sp.]